MGSIIDYEGKRHTATLKLIDYKNDIALISVNMKPKYNAFIRMDNKYENAITPVLDEEVNIIGSPKGIFEPRGGLVTKLYYRILNDGIFSIGIEPSYGCAGAPILDERGLLIGLLSDVKNIQSPYRNADEKDISICGLDASLIFPILRYTKVSVGTSNQKNAPFNIINFEGFERTKKIVEWGSLFTVNIFCSEKY